MKILECESITKSYEGNKIIDKVSLFVKRGETVALLGVSGKGKTTLFNIASGLEKPDEGKVFLEGEDITGVPGRIGYMQQSDLLLPFKSVIKNVMIPLRLQKVDKKCAQEMAGEILKEFSLYECRDMYPGQLSGGMRQRAALARSVLIGSSVMLLDEPFSALDAITRGEMQLWFKKVAKKKQLATLFITHDIDEAIVLADRIYILAGEIGSVATVIDVRDRKGTEEEKACLKKEILTQVK